MQDLLGRRAAAVRAANDILGVHEGSPARIVELKESFSKLSALPVDIAEYYREGLKALQIECYRAAVVLAWAGFVHVLAAKLVQGYQTELKRYYGSWNTDTTSELLESTSELQVLEAAKKCGLIPNQQLNIYKGWLSTRNQCAHPTLFQPSRNVTLGYVDGVIAEVSKFM